MKKSIVLIVLMMFVAASAFSAVIIQEDFGPADDGTLPASLDAEWDPGVDVKVYSLGSLAVPTDHRNGDGYVLGIGDIEWAGYNFCFSASYATDAYTDGVVECWAYCDFASATGERDYGVFIRTGPDTGGGKVYSARLGYWLFVTVSSSWGSYIPTDYHAFILKRSGSAWVQVGTEGAGSYTDGWHKLRLEVTGTTVNGYVDGNLEVSATDTEYTQGTAGMVLYEANDTNFLGAFDNFYWDDSPTAGIDTWTLY